MGVDFFAFKGSSYLLLIDYYSRYVEMSKLHSTTSAAVIQHMKSIYTRHGIPEILVSDNGPQFSAEIFTQFTQNFDFQHQTNSPNFPQGNGEIERAVKTVKSMLEKATDPYIGLLSYRTTPLANGYSPAELLMNRKLRSTGLVSYRHCNKAMQCGSLNSKGMLRSSLKLHHVRTQYKLQRVGLGGIEEI